MVQKMPITSHIPSLRGQVTGKSTIFKELTPRSRTYEFCGKGEKSIYKFKDKQTPHTVLQKLSPKPSPTPQGLNFTWVLSLFFL